MEDINDTTGPDMDADASMFPLDPRKLVKGETLDPVALGLIQSKPGTVKYSTDLMKLSGDIGRAIDRMKCAVSVCIVGHNIKVMTDAEAAQYHDDMADRGLRMMARHAAHMRRRIDRGLLDDSQKENHLRNSALWALRVSSARKPMRALANGKTEKQVVDEAQAKDSRRRLLGIKDE